LTSRFPFFPQFSYELDNAFMVEQNGHSARGDKHGHTVADYQSAWVIDLEAMTTYQFHRKGVKWRALLQTFQTLVKVVGRHGMLFLMNRSQPLRS
jgi:hypothetical protein